MTLKPGFVDAVFEAQAAFRAVMNALARPGSHQPIAGLSGAPAPLSPVAAAIVLTLADFETPVHLDGPLLTERDVAAFLTFHTGAPLVSEPGRALFAVVSDAAHLPPLDHFAVGTDTYPDRSTTLIVQVKAFGSGRRYGLAGPGIKGTADLQVEGLPADIATRLAANHALFPRGVDIVLAGPDGVVGLPRTTRMQEA